MVEVTFENFQPLFPALRLTQTAFDLTFELVKPELEEGFFKDSYPKAAFLLIAHNHTLNQRRGGNGNVTEETTGKLSTQYGEPKSDDSYNSTVYGRQYVELVKKLSVTVMWVG